MAIRTAAIKTPETATQQENETLTYINDLIERSELLYNAGWRPQAARHFIDGMHQHPSFDVRTYAYTSELERKLTELVGRVHHQSEFEDLLVEVYNRFVPASE